MSAPSQKEICVPRSGASRLVRDWAVYLRLIKIRLVFLVLVSYACGFFLGGGAGSGLAVFLPSLAAAALMASGVLALNQWMEHEYDDRMKRTAARPIPSGDLSPAQAKLFGAALLLSGGAVLLASGQVKGFFIGALIALLYLGFYTPMKRWTPFCVYVGALAGALPPLMGWAASGTAFGSGAWALAGILFFWQLLHFTAIAWIYRQEYAGAGFVLSEVKDMTGVRTSRKALVWGLLLALTSFVPYFIHMAGSIYFGVACLLSGILLYLNFLAVRFHSKNDARHLMLGSLAYLFILLAVMMLDKI
jgi:protoheme IX farnesyltransferase